MDGKPTSKEKDLILSSLTEDEKRFIYQNPKGDVIFTPVYKAYNNLFFKAVVNNTQIKSDFEAFKDTSVYERYMLNAVQFSAAKSMAESKLMQSAVFTDDDKIKSYSQFKKDADQITEVFQKTWLRTEYDTGVKQAVNGELFTRMRADKDLYPYWEYLETDSDHPREEHLELVGNVYKIGDAEGDMVFPPNGFNCGCGSEQVDDDYLDANDKEVSDGKASLEFVDPQFRYNPADQGIMPKESHSYHEAVSSANVLSYKNFVTEDEKFQDVDQVMEAARGAADQVHEIGQKYADEFDGTVTPVNFKSRDSIIRKADADFNGDVSQLKDVVRNTVVVDYDELDGVVHELKADPLFDAVNGGKVKVQEGQGYFGYKGVITNYVADNGLTVEMQFNSPGMIYAKVPEKEALHIMTKTQYDEIAKATGLPGGQGHDYYEQIRVLVAKINKGTNTADDVKKCLQAIKDSRTYYSKFYGY